CFGSSVLTEAVVVLASSNRSSNSRIRRVSSSGNLGSVDPICWIGGGGKKTKKEGSNSLGFFCQKRTKKGPRATRDPRSTPGIRAASAGLRPLSQDRRRSRELRYRQARRVPTAQR